MDVQEALDHARFVMDLNGLAHWNLKTDQAVGRLGQCNYTTQSISFSEPLLEANPFNIFYDTLLHEMAHALVGQGYKPHGPEWKAKARELGLENPTAGTDEADLPDSYYRYAGDCRGDHPQHSAFRRHRMNRKSKYLCTKCQRVIVWFDRKLQEVI